MAVGLSIVLRFRYTIDMKSKQLARDVLWNIAELQHGFVTAQQAVEAGISTPGLQMLVHRGTLVRQAHGVYRFPKYPVSEHGQKILAVLWTGVPEAVLSHETALDAYGLTDINPHVIHLTVSPQRRIRRTGGEAYVVHYEDVDAAEKGWWEEVPIVLASKAIEQCIEGGTPTYLLRQALENGQKQGYLTTGQREALQLKLEARHE
ncbi:putative transcriptional regulator of viral defense system [Aurantimicrobium minutum]|jgi:predicted transcriptional regulator of viral defense system|nr:putative transcriptional regulator of viral defense system [Aurantimicrobium minutum]